MVEDFFDCLVLSPQGTLKTVRLSNNVQGAEWAKINDKKIIKAFEASQYLGLLTLLATKKTDYFSKGLLYWRNYIQQYGHALSRCETAFNTQISAFSAPVNFIKHHVKTIPPLPGAEYCSEEALINLWHGFDDWLQLKISKDYQSITDFLSAELPLWRSVGRICLHLAENKQDETNPFAFIATYAATLKSDGKTQYQPLGKALQAYAGAQNKHALMQLLQPLSDAAKQCDWLNNLVENHDIYHPLAWSPTEAYQLLQSVTTLETAGLTVKLPNWWKKRTKPKVQLLIGNNAASHLSADKLLSFDLNVSLAGEALTQQETEALMASDNGLTLLRGQWIELDKDKLAEALSHWQTVQDNHADDGLTFIEGMRLLAGINQEIKQGALENDLQDWCSIEASDALKTTLASLRAPETLNTCNVGTLLKANLRHYQKAGVAWLNLLTGLGLGACLADDMGLGKTIQIIALLLIQKKQVKKKSDRLASLLVLPASLLSNWRVEISQFAPSLKIILLHPSEMKRSDFDLLTKNEGSSLSEFDLVITTYGMLLRQPWLTNIKWHLTILDEAQAIKNPSSKQTQQVKKLSAKARIALTGTPVENRLGDLWSLFDFICPGLLGNSATFKLFVKSLDESKQNSYEPLRQLVSPYLLRRLKTDKKVISDLPDKTEVNAWCGLSTAQAKLYAQAVNELTTLLKSTEDGIKRKGMILAFLTRFKQICNHPCQWLNEPDFPEALSGKFLRLRELCEEIASRQEKVLVFTQYRAMIKPLQSFLATIFQDKGLSLHGGTAVKKRQTLVEDFQSDNGSLFFVLSLKAAGTGLNLTAANHVIHFDRWWNPAVENQATDRAFRIGQKKNVLVHKFICKGTIEEKINIMLCEKQDLSDRILSSGNELTLTEMNDEQLLKLVALDVGSL